ncbi:MAG TPA: choice-of-anchor Q domain-containing protein [Kofleriaceae bacterium]|nr:choice-of-anchor Q domain-containing protein [Kofleriaceae bacterium]
MIALVTSAARVEASTYYVDPAGDDANDGSSAAPLRTIQAAANRVAPGDEVIVRAGVYENPSSGFLITLDRGGTADAWVTFRSETPGAAIIDGGDNRSSHCWVLLGGARYVRIEGFEVRGCRDAAFHSNAGAQHVTYARNHIHDIGRLCTDTTSGKTGFYQGSGSAYHVYDGNVVHDIGRFSPGEQGCQPSTEYYENHDHAIYLNASHALVVNNVFYKLEHGWPVHIYGSAQKDDIAILHNTFALPNPHRDGHIKITAGTSNLVITNNIFYSPTTAGAEISSCSGVATVTIHHNLSNKPAIVAGDPCGSDVADNALEVDPEFVDPAAFDFQLQPSSPAIDTGAAIEGAPDHDALGVMRPQGAGFDLGAYERATGSPPSGDAGTDVDDPPGMQADESGCSVAGSASWLALVAIVPLVVRRRRRVLALALVAGCASAPGDSETPATDAAGDTVPADGSVEPALVQAVDVSVWTRTLTDPDVDCLWDDGYRHVIIGTQNLEVTRQQIAIAARGGMTIDLYVYLYWQLDITAQVAEAVALRAEFPQVGRIWLDVEDDPAGRSPAALRALIDQAIAALGDAPGGIYTGKGWWQSYLEDTTAYADQPLWYARYDNQPSLDAWNDPAEDERFGGWQAPAGKQYADYHVHTCELAVDRNLIWVSAAPTVVVDRSTPPDDGTPPDAPTQLAPRDGLVVTTEYVRPTAPALRDATSYEIALESWEGSAFAPYWTTTRPVSDLLVFPTRHDRDYRWRIRAANAHGFGPWSEWAVFTFRG